MSRRFTGRPPPLSTHPSGKYWGKPPALTPPGHKGKGKGGRTVFSEPEESICDTIDHSNLRGILRDLCYWQSHVTTVEELAGKVTSADWYPLLLGKLAESVVVISGAPNVGKSSLAVHLAKTLGLMRTKTTSKNFWLFARSERPYFPTGCIAQIRSGVKMSHRGLGCDSLYHLLPQAKNSAQEQSFSRVTEFLLFQVMPTWPPLLFTWRLRTNFCLSEEQKQGQSGSTSFSCRMYWTSFKSSTR